MKRSFLALAGLLFVVQSMGQNSEGRYSHAPNRPYSKVNNKAYLNKISIGVGLGYRSEYNTSGYFIEYEPLKNVKISAGAAISVYVPAGISLGAKWFVKDMLVKKANKDGGKAKFLSPFIGCTYMMISENRVTYSNSGVFSDFHFPGTSYIITSTGIRISGVNYNARSRNIGHAVYLYLDYKARIKGGDLEYENGPPMEESQTIVNRLIGSGLGCGMSFVLDLRIKQKGWDTK